MSDKNVKPENEEFVGDNEDYIFLESDNKPHSERWL